MALMFFKRKCLNCQGGLEGRYFSRCVVFFYDLEVQTWGFAPKDKPHFRVIYVEDECKSINPILKPDNLSS